PKVLAKSGLAYNWRLNSRSVAVRGEPSDHFRLGWRLIVQVFRSAEISPFSAEGRSAIPACRVPVLSPYHSGAHSAWSTMAEAVSLVSIGSRVSGSSKRPSITVPPRLGSGGGVDSGVLPGPKTRHPAAPARRRSATSSTPASAAARRGATIQLTRR